MRRMRFLAILAWMLLMRAEPLLGEPMRGVELDPRAPASLVKTLADAGVNTVVLPFRTQGDLSDEDFVQAVRRWGRLSKQHGVRCFVAVRVFGPYDYVGAQRGYSRAKESFAGVSPCVCPTNPKYWREVIAPRARRIAELAKAHGLAGALLDYQATLTGNEYDANYCFNKLCWHAFIDERKGGNEKLRKLPKDARVSWVRSRPTGGEYYEFLSQKVEAEMKEVVGGARTVSPDVVLGIYGYHDEWLYRGVVRALNKAHPGSTPPAVMGAYAQCSFSTLYPLLKQNWARHKLRFDPVARLPIDYYLPREVRHHIATLPKSEVGFLLTDATALTRRVEDLFHAYPPHGTPGDFAKAIQSGLAGNRAKRPLIFCEQPFSSFYPRLGILHGTGLSGFFSGMLKRLAESFQLPSIRFDSTRPDEWLDVLPNCESILVLPGAVESNPDGMAQAADRLRGFAENGGILIVLNGANEVVGKLLEAMGERFTCKGQRAGVTKTTWLDNQGDGLLARPVLVDNLPSSGMHFVSQAKSYKPLAKDDTGSPFVLRQNVGRGMVLVSAGALIPVELLANAYFDLTRRGDVFRIGLLPGADTMLFGENRLELAVAELPETARNVDVLVDVIDSSGASCRHERRDVSIADDGIVIPLQYTARDEGAGRIVVTLADPHTRAVLCRERIDLLHDRRVDVLPDKNYYTTEDRARLRLTYADPALMSAEVRVEIGNQSARCEGGMQRVRFVDVPIDKLTPGEHALTTTFIRGGEVAYRRTVTVTKRPSFPTAVKILHHRSGVLEVDGKAFFPFGAYGVDKALAAIGVNTTVGGDAGKGSGIRHAPHGAIRKWARSDEWPRKRVLEELSRPNHERLLSWYMYDEPALNGHSPQAVGAMYRAARAKDPYHPQMIVYVGSCTYIHYPDYMPTADCHMMDHYPLPYFAPSTYGYFLRKVTQASRGRKNVWGVPQSFDWREIGAGIGPYREQDLHPYGPEALSYIYQSIIEGAGAITFWKYSFMAKDADRREDFHRALTEGAKITPLVTQGVVIDPPRVRPFSSQVHARAFRVGDAIHIVAANYLERPAKVTFEAPYLKGKRLERYLPDEKTLTDLSDSFTPLQGKVYVVKAK